MICKNCGAQLQKEDTFCALCGKDVQNKEKEAVKCTECGKFFNKEFGMCPFCGTELAEDNIELTDNQDIPLSVTDTEEPFVKEDTEGNFVLCPKCNNKYDINIGRCTVCGYYATESECTPNKQEEDDSICPDCGEQIDKEYGLCFSCGYSVKKSKVNSETNENKENIEKELSTNPAKVAFSDELQNADRSVCADSNNNKHVNYKKIGIIAAVVVCVVIVLSVILSSPKRIGVSMNQIRTDIGELSVVKNGVIESEYTPFDPYTVDFVEIDKRQTNIEDKEDIVYCNVVISNEYYQTDLQIKLVYNYYDDGGWIADDHEIVSKNSVAVSGVDLNLCKVAYYENDFNYINPNAENCTISQETDIINQTDIIYITDEENHYTVDASAMFTFDQNRGWQTLNSNDNKEIVPKIYNVVFDYDSVMKGDFETTGKAEAFGFEFPYERRLKITSYNNESGELQGSYYHYNSYNSSQYTAESFKTVLKKQDNSITFPAVRKYHGTSEIFVTLNYNFDEDAWYIANGQIIERK